MFVFYYFTGYMVFALWPSIWFWYGYRSHQFNMYDKQPVVMMGKVTYREVDIWIDVVEIYFK